MKDLLTQAMKSAIDQELAKYPADRRRSASLASIRIVQDLGAGWVNDEQLEAIAEYLQIPAVEVYEVATFYTMCKRDPIGKYHISICTNVSCMLNEAEGIVDHLKKRLSLGFGETSKDGKFSLEEVECLGSCTTAPMCQINKAYYEKLTCEKVDAILDELSEQ
jgi:NADH-quinone oxidoreductase subunit E